MEMYYLAQQVDGLHPTLKVFHGRAPVRTHSVLTTFRDNFDTIGVSEATTVQVLAYFMDGEAVNVLSEQCF